MRMPTVPTRWGIILATAPVGLKEMASAAVTLTNAQLMLLVTVMPAATTLLDLSCVVAILDIMEMDLFVQVHLMSIRRIIML